MATPVVVNGDTSLVLVNTRDLTANQSEVVILSSISYPGRTVTIRDSAGFLSSPQTIIVSTQRGVLFADGTSSIVLTQPYAYLTVSSRDATSWSLKNSFGFPQNLTVANAASLTTSSIVTSNVYAYGFMSTPYVNLQTLTAMSSMAVYGTTYTSSLYVGGDVITTRNNPGYSLYVEGDMKTLGNIDIEGSMSVTANISTGSNLFVHGNISTLGNFGASGDIMTLGNVLAPNGFIITSNLDVRGQTNIGGPASFSNTLAIGTHLTVSNSITTSNLITSTIQVTSSITMQDKSISYRTTDLFFSAPITVPSIGTLNLTASNAIMTSNLTVYTTINAQQATSFLMSSTAIANPFGSLTISSIAANTASFSNRVITSHLATSSITASTILLSGDLNARAGGYLNMNAVTASTISTGVLYANVMNTGYFNTPSLEIERLTVASQFVADGVRQFSASNVLIDNTGGSISTSRLSVQNVMVTSTLITTSGEFLTTSGNIRFGASNVIIDTAAISTLAASTITTSSLTASQITIGGAPTVDNGPFFIPDTTRYPAVNTVATGGPGDYLTPYFVSNVRPPGIGAGQPYTVDASFTLTGPQLPGYFATIRGLTLYPNGEPNCELTLRTTNDSNTITTLYGLFGTVQTYSTPPNTGGIPTPTPRVSSLIHVTGTMYGASAFSLQFQSLSNENYSGVNSNNTLTMNNGVLRWPYSLNGTTIQNSLNDMSARTLYYYGALNFASDPALKENVQDADLLRCYTTVENLPLRRFKYIDPYLSTFQQSDVHRLGLIATELESVFPKSVTYTQINEIPGYQSTFRMIDTQQVEMAHIGATKMLMAKVSTLYTTLQLTRQEISTLVRT
jgi:hypothetical protein